METFSAIMKLIGLVLLVVIGIVLIVAFGGAFLIIFGSFLLLFLIAWMFGIPVTIKQNGVKVGYVRWFTFHRSF
jgi:hypothetical protein